MSEKVGVGFATKKLERGLLVIGDFLKKQEECMEKTVGQLRCKVYYGGEAHINNTYKVDEEHLNNTLPAFMNNLGIDHSISSENGVLNITVRDFRLLV